MHSLPANCAAGGREPHSSQPVEAVAAKQRNGKEELSELWQDVP